MNVCILDDIEVLADAIKKMVLCIPNDYKEETRCYTFYNSIDFCKWLDEGNIVDVCFLDIKLEGEKVNGLDIAKRLKTINYRTLIIFISDYDIYYKDMVQVEPFRFLHKPFTSKEVISVFKLACERYFLQNTNIVQIYHYKYNGVIYSTELNKIKYIYSLKRKIFMKTSSGETLEFYGKLDIVENEISDISNNFLRIGKSYLVNTRYIKSFNKNFIKVDNEEFSIGLKYRNRVIETLNNEIIT